jgi:hypothetical protein
MEDLIKTHAVKTFAVAIGSGDNPKTIVAAVSGKKICVLSYIMSSATNGTYKWQSKPAGDAVDISGLIYLQAAGTTVHTAPHAPRGWFVTAVGAALQIANSGIAGSVTGTYVEM